VPLERGTFDIGSWVPWSKIKRILGFFSCNDSDVEECQSIYFIVAFISPSKVPSSCFLLNLVLSYMKETFVKRNRGMVGFGGQACNPSVLGD
jgi:hypothetical protein